MCDESANLRYVKPCLLCEKRFLNDSQLTYRQLRTDQWYPEIQMQFFFMNLLEYRCSAWERATEIQTSYDPKGPPKYRPVMTRKGHRNTDQLWPERATEIQTSYDPKGPPRYRPVMTQKGHRNADQLWPERATKVQTSYDPSLYWKSLSSVYYLPNLCRLLYITNNQFLYEQYRWLNGKET